MSGTQQPQTTPFRPLDDLDQFAIWFSHQTPVPLAPFDAVTFVGEFAQLTLIRQPPYQVQVCLCRPNSIIPEHRHPDVDTILVYVAGEILLTIDGKEAVREAEIKINPDGRCSHLGMSWRLKPGVLHGAKIGAAGAAFMTIQKWVLGEPKSVELNWVGPPLGADHIVPIVANG